MENSEKSEKKILVKNEQDFIRDMLEFCEEMSQGLSHIHEKGQDDLEILLGEHQWEQSVEKWRKAQVPPRPVFSQNLLPAFTDQVKNDQRQNRPQVKAIPVDSKGDPATALVIAGLIRNIWYQSQADAVHDQAFDSVVDCGLAAWRVHPEYEHAMSQHQNLIVSPIDNPFAVIWDLSAKKFDTSDKKRCMILDVIGTDEFEKRWPGRNATGTDSPKTTGVSEAGWFQQDKVQIAEYWYVDERDATILFLSNGEAVEKKDEALIQKMLRRFAGIRIVGERKTRIPQVRTCIASGAEILEGPFEMPGQYIPVIIAQGKVMNIRGKKHIKSLIRDAKQTQQIHNYLITSMIESYAMQPNVPYVGTVKQFEGRPEWDTANIGGKSKMAYNPDPTAPGPPKREDPPAISNQLFPMIEGNKQNMRAIIGIYEAGLGMRSNETSGKAIMARQRESDTGSFVFLSNFLIAMQFEGRILADLIPSYYDAQRAIMITGIEGEHKKVLINQAAEDGNLYNVKAGKYDVIITTGPSFTSQREETFQTMVDLIQPTMATNPAAGSVLLLEMTKLLNTPNNERLVKLIKATLPPQVQAVMDQEDAAESSGGESTAIAVQQAVSQVEQQLGPIMQAAEQKIAELQQQLGEAQQQLQDRQAEHSIKVKELEMKQAEGAGKAAIERERAQADVLIAQIQAQSAEEIKSVTDQIAALTSLVEKMQKTVENLAAQEREPEKEEVTPTMQPIVIPIGGNKKVTITGPSGKKYTGEVTEEASETP